MRIKSLELNGFKSFVDRTTVVFQPGITAVVGPNGCGKSNVVDAIRWAMGEQSPRRLRGKGMEDVIFGGSEGRSPIGMAEVTLTFDNEAGDGPAAFAAYSEIQVARRLYRSGESEYSLNRTPCRLRDIQDFFRDTGIGTKGYTIVEQGRIAEIVSARAEERRTLIEEAAGIGKYKARRREAESKIASTEQNLLRVSDVLSEIRRQIGAIERQARKAARYKRLRETLRVLELSLAAEDRRELAEAIAGARGKFTALGEQLAALETRLAERELAVREKRIEQTERERLLSQGTETLLALRTEIKQCEGQIEFGRRERESLAETVAARRGELTRLREQVAVLEREVAETGDELRATESAVASEREVVARAEEAARDAMARLQGLEAERERINAALVEALTGIARGEDRIAALEDRRAERDARMRSADEGLEEGQSESARADRKKEALEEGLRNLLAERDRLMGLVRSALETHEGTTRRAAEAAEALHTARETREMRRARHDSLREVVEQNEDVAAGVRHLLSRDETERRSLGIRGLVRDVLAADPEVERAVEAVLADRAQALVVDDTAGALSALAALRDASAGRGVFVVMPSEPEPTGIVPLGQPLIERVRPRAGFEDLARALLQGVNLVDDLREVVAVYAAGRVPATFVTPHGDLLAPDGVVRGGDAGGEGASGGLLSRVREVRDLESEVTRLDAEVGRCESEHEASRAALARVADELDNLRNRHHTAALAVANHEKDIERNDERVKALGEAQEGRVVERSELMAEIDALGGDRARLDADLDLARGDRTGRQRELDALGLKIGSERREVTRLETIATERRVEHAGRAENRDRLRAAHDRSRSALAETREWIERRDQEIASAEARRAELATVIEGAETTLAERLHDEEAARMSNDEKREAYEGVTAALGEIEEGVRELRGDITERREEISKAELEVRESELRLSHLDESIREKWEVDLATWSPPMVEARAEPQGAVPEPQVSLEPQDSQAPDSAEAPGEDPEEMAPDAAREARANAELTLLPVRERRVTLEDVRRRIGALGEVNLAAIEEHEDLNERHRFLAEQKDDLERTLQSLRDAIQRINRTSRKLFRETFEAVSKRFAENFPRLFRGGKASLSLTESEDILDAGIDIMAMPPGKRLQNVNLLSGGEKTLTAIALLVAVFQVRPSPFFLLDEVDAALDDANVGRFNEIVRELASDSQFVLITHNKRTIEIADVLYGVTMERKGVSKLVSVEMC